MSGKGSARRPRFVPLAELQARWDATFGGRDFVLVPYDGEDVDVLPGGGIVTHFDGSTRAERAARRATPPHSAPDDAAR